MRIDDKTVTPGPGIVRESGVGCHFPEKMSGAQLTPLPTFSAPFVFLPTFSGALVLRGAALRIFPSIHGI